MTDTYNTITSAGEGLYKEKGSKFIAYSFPVQTEEEIKSILDEQRKVFYNARHICYAYKLGYDDNSPYRMNDDGEPSGTAGKPIYGQILSHELTDILIVVVRYFGGTKLGVSGLINAYKSATLDALNTSIIIEKVRQTTLKVNYDFALTNETMRIVKDYDLTVVKQSYDTGCHLTIKVRLSDYERVKSVFGKTYGITVEKDE